MSEYIKSTQAKTGRADFVCEVIPNIPSAHPADPSIHPAYAKASADTQGERVSKDISGRE